MSANLKSNKFALSLSNRLFFFCFSLLAEAGNLNDNVRHLLLSTF